MTYKEAHSELIRAAAVLVRGNMSGLSPYRVDMPKSTPAKVMRMIQAEAERQMALGIRIKAAADILQACAYAGGVL